MRTWLLNTFAVNHLINESHHLKRRILFEEIPSGQRFLTQIIEAMRDSHTLEISYQSFWNDTPRTFEVAPSASRYSTSGGMSWHAARAMTGCASMRWTASGSSALGTPVHPARRFLTRRPILPIRSASRSIRRYKPEQVRVRVSGIQRQYLRTLPLHASQLETEITDDSSVFEFYLRPTFDFEQELLTHAANTDGQIEVLQPQWLREEMKQIGLNLVEAHKTVGREQ